MVFVIHWHESATKIFLTIPRKHIFVHEKYLQWRGLGEDVQTSNIWGPHSMVIAENCINWGLPWWLSGRNMPTMKEMKELWVWSLRWEDPLEEGMAATPVFFCLENPMDRGAWWATVHRVTRSHIWLKQLNMHTCYKLNMKAKNWFVFEHFVHQCLQLAGESGGSHFTSALANTKANGMTFFHGSQFRHCLSCSAFLSDS